MSKRLIALAALALLVPAGCGTSAGEQEVQEQEERMQWLDQSLSEGSVGLSVAGEGDDCESMVYEVEQVDVGFSDIEVTVRPSECLEE